MSASDRPDDSEEALLSEQWYAPSQRPIVDSAAFFRLPKQGEFRILLGFARDPIVIYGGGVPCRHDSAATCSPSNPVTPPALIDFMTMKEIAKAIRRSYSWVSKNWKKTMRLTPRHIGATLYFKRSEIEGYIERSLVRRKPTGRPKIVVGIIHHAKS